MLDVVMDPNKYYLCAIGIEDKVIYDVVRITDKYAYTHSGFAYPKIFIIENFGEYSDITRPEK